MFWLSAWGNLHDPFVAGVNISGEGWAVKGVERNEVDIWSYCWNLCGKQEKDLQTTKKQDLNIEKGGEKS